MPLDSNKEFVFCLSDEMIYYATRLDHSPFFVNLCGSIWRTYLKVLVSEFRKSLCV